MRQPKRLIKCLLNHKLIMKKSKINMQSSMKGRMKLKNLNLSVPSLWLRSLHLKEILKELMVCMSNFRKNSRNKDNNSNCWLMRLVKLIILIESIGLLSKVMRNNYLILIRTFLIFKRKSKLKINSSRELMKRHLFIRNKLRNSSKISVKNQTQNPSMMKRKDWRKSVKPLNMMPSSKSSRP